MSQLKKGILNGWKEIGGYVGRDIRTVERWEKQRGLPVRRVPGSGRATVYALISELDDWLAASKSEAKEAEFSGLGEAVPPPVLQEQLTEPPATALPVQADTASLLIVEQTHAKPWDVPGQPGFVERRKTVSLVPAADLTERMTWAGVAAAVGCGLIWLLAWPVSKSHAKNVPVAQSSPDGAIRSVWVPRSSQVPGVDPLYLEGIYYYEQRTPESLEHSLKDFNDAIAKDPGYAPAYAGLANAYNLLREYSGMPEAEAYTKAREAAERAIALDPKLPDAHASLGFIDFFWSWDRAAAENEFRTAIALNPSSVVAHHWYGSMLVHEGRYDEALEQLDIAQRLDPTSTAVLSTRALALGMSGHRGEAEAILQDMINETPGATSPHAMLETLSQVQPQDPAQFIGEMRRVGELRRSDSMVRTASAAEQGYRTGGERGMWAAIFDEEARSHPESSEKTYLMVQAEVQMGRNEAALEDLTRLAQKHDPNLIGLVVDPNFSTLHGDPRFGQLVATVGLPPLQRR